jgi:translin
MIVIHTLGNIMARLKKLDEIVKGIETELDKKEEARELSIKSARLITRMSGSAIRKMQQDEKVQDLLQKSRKEAQKLKQILNAHPELAYTGYVETAFQELSEAFIVSAIRNNKPLPSPKAINVTETAYLLGMGDAVGELRRFTIHELTKGNLKRAHEYMKLMEDLFHALMRFDYPHAIVAIRRKQDIARGLLEKTRGELLVSSRSRELERKIDRLHKRLR